MEITKKNFCEEFQSISKNLQRSCFIGFDAEFTAILSGDCFKNRLFDTSEEKYDKIKNEVSKMIMTQVGLTMFQYNRDLDTYVAVGYTFHLCPQTFADIDQSFIFQASTLKFLCRHNFNFNKFTYEGIPYLSNAEQLKLQQNVKNKTLHSDLARTLDLHEEKQLQQYCSEVSRWLSKGDEDTMYIDMPNPVLRYLIHCEVRLRFPNVLTTDSLGNSNKILIYRDKYVEGANSAPMAILEENLIIHLLGFSQIIQLLAHYKKPIVGHNIFLDLILLHNQFIGPLPKRYSLFKKNINEMFPTVFDTKYISHDLSKKLSIDEVWRSNSLQDLYEFFSESKCRKLENGVNFIKLSTPFNVNQSYHEAGWDSYCTGYCFIRLAHWMACENSGKYRPISPREKLAALAPYCNKVNIIRGATPYMNLVGKDPPSHRPNLLHIKSVRERILNIEKVISTLAGFGSVDVKPYGRRTALIAANSQYTADGILKQFKGNRDYKITLYNAYRHSPASYIVMWSGAIITGSLLLFLLHKKVKS